MGRSSRLLWWLLPPLVCLLLYWPGLWAWFQQDDFAWLNLAQDLREGKSLWSAMFRPSHDQGSLRPLSERAYYLALPAVFGLNAFPFRLLAFLTQFGSLWLAAALVGRISGSPAAGVLASLLWIVNSKLFVVMTWPAGFNLILCGFLLLLALHLFLRHIDTGRNIYLAGCWAAFLTGFGVLETNAVFPLLAAGYALAFSRRSLWKTLPMFGASAIFTAMHVFVIPKATHGPYAVMLDFRIPLTLWKYWQWAFIPEGMTDYTKLPGWAGPAMAWLFTCTLLGYAAWQARRARWAPLCYLGWFVVTVLPVLAAPQHMSDYYLTLPALGVGMLGADAVWYAWRQGWRLRAPALALTALFVYSQAPAARGGSQWWHDRSQRGREWLMQLKAAHSQHPNKVILLTGVNDDLFWNAMAHHAPRAAGMLHVYLAPGADAGITPHPELTGVHKFVYPLDRFAERFPLGEVEVYRVHGTGLEKVTDLYRRTTAAGLIGPVWWMDVADPAEEWRLKSGWHRIEGHYRWTAGRAEVEIPGPERAGQQFWTRGYGPDQLLSAGPVRVTVSLDGSVIGVWELNQAGDFEFRAPLDKRWVGKERLRLLVEVSRTMKLPNDERELGIIFGRFGIR